MIEDQGLLAGYHRYRRRVADEQPDLVRLASGQAPRALWIGCSDSRVIPEQITDADPGELFVMRNVANIVPVAGSDDAVGAIIEFAVSFLKVARIIVCGHSGCGGIAALSGSIDGELAPHLTRWIELARPAEAQVADADTPDSERSIATVKANVLLQRRNVLTYPCVAAGLTDGALEVQAGLYILETGEVLAFNDASQAWVSLSSPAET